jgi:predicted ribosomally synthesized peptide with SipW-like signal peptide
MKKVILSVSMLVIITVISIGATTAYYSDTEKSTANVFTAGAIDLKVDHLKQTYNDVDCKTCSVVVKSDTSNMVVEKNGSPLTPYNAVPAWVHSVWTSHLDPTLQATGAQWIWESNPVKLEDTQNTTSYTFKKTFEWYGPITDSDLWMGVGSDNSVEVWLNGVKVGNNTSEYGYIKEHMLHIPGSDITSNIVQGINELEFVTTNWGILGSTPQSNPAGLIYKFSIDGLCGDNYFRKNCTLWGEKDLAPGDQFFNIDDVKPGDRGINVISLHVYDNDAWACLFIHDKEDAENVMYPIEEKAGDTTEDVGELSKYIEVFGWNDKNQNGVFEPLTEEVLFDGLLSEDVTSLPIADSLHGTKLDPEIVEFVGLAWCAGTQTVDLSTGNIACGGGSMGNDAQSDSLEASLTVYTEQHRNNIGFECEDVEF